MRLLLIWAVAVVLSAATAMAQEQRLKAGALRYVFEQWMQDQGVDEASFVTLFRGVEVGRPLSPDRTVELASLSKAITAVCVAELIAEGIWSHQTTAAQVLGKGPPGLTLTQLVTHTGRVAPDKTQGMRWVLRDMNAPLIEEIASAALDRNLGTQGSYFYNNENYAILGQMIEKVLGVSYAAACTPRALDPAGVTTAQASATMGGTLPWGGWAMSLRDYARFQYHWFGPDGPYSAGSPAALRVDIGGGAAYGLGIFERATRRGHNLWHFGSWCMPFRVNAGTYAVIWEGEWSVVASYDICIGAEEHAALDHALSKVIYGQ